MEKILLYGSGVPSSITDLFTDFGYDAMQIPKCSLIDEAVSAHPDMLFSVLGEGCVITDSGYFAENRAFFDTLARRAVTVKLSERALTKKYPGDVLFDAIRTEDLLIGNLKHTAPELFGAGVRAVNVKQGYALCSTLLINGAAVSADLGICSALRENGYDVLQITPGEILLNGYAYGFIGGASAVLERERAVLFFGNVYKHPDGEKIVRFCEGKGYRVYYDKDTPLTDCGGVKII